MSRHRWQLLAPLICSITVSGCQTNEAMTPATMAAPDARAVILASKGTLWRDPDSIKNASITAPRRSTGILPMWHVCVRANAKNAFGGYVGEKDMLIGIYDDGQPPAALMADAAGYCEFQHEPFPELEGGYVATKRAPRT